MAFTSSAFAVAFVFKSVVNVINLLSLSVLVPLVSLSLSLFESLLLFLFLYFSLLLWLLLSLLLFEEWISPGGEIFRFSVSFSAVAVFDEHIGGHSLGDQSHNGVFLEFL